MTWRPAKTTARDPAHLPEVDHLTQFKRYGMRVREASVQDAEELTTLARESKATWGYPEAWLRAWEPDLLISPDYIGVNLVLVAEEEGQIVGMIGVEVGREGPEIGHLWVAPGAQGRGVGRVLVGEVLELAADCGWASLRVVSDPNAEPFYERMGAVRVGGVSAPVGGEDRTLPLMSLPVPRRVS